MLRSIAAPNATPAAAPAAGPPRYAAASTSSSAPALAGANTPNRLIPESDKSTVAVSTKSVTGLRQSFSSRGGAKAAPYIQHTPNVMPCTSRNVSTAGAVSSAPSGRNTNVHAALANVATPGANHRSDITRRPAHTLITHSTSSAAAA